MLTDKVGSESGPCGEMTAVDGLDPCSWDRIATRGMEERNMVAEVGSVVGAVGLCGWHEETVIS